MRAALRVLAWVGWGALGLVAALGLALASLAAIAAFPVTRPIFAARVVRLADEAIAGSLVLKGVAVLPHGGIELRGLEVYDPDGHLVLSVGRARLSLDVTSLRARTLGVTLELESPSVILEEEPGGGLSLARAFAPTRTPGAPRAGGAAGARWTFHVSRLTVRGGELWWIGARGETRLEASGLDLDARGVIAPGRTRVDLRLRGALDAPTAGPIAVDVVGGITGDAVRVPVLRAQLGGTALSATGEGDLARRSGRVAVTRLGLVRALARSLSPRTPAGDDLAATGYAESDGAVVTVAARAEPVGEQARGRADVAVAARLSDPAGAFGFDAILDHLDPARLVAEAPPGDVTLTARGALSGRSLRELHGRLAATIQRSRLRRGELARAEVVARAERGTVEVSRAAASAAGVDLDGAFRWREGGEVSGRVTLDARDLAAALANAGALLGARLPALEGRARVQATLAGTSGAPSAAATVDAPWFRVGRLGLLGSRLTASLSGPAAHPSGRVEGRIAAVQGGGRALARDVTVRGGVAQDTGSLTALAGLPGFRDPASIDLRGRLGPRRDTLVVSDLTFSYPGERWALAAPATVVLSGPSVDRLELVAGAQRVALAGGLVRGRQLAARLELARVDVARLPEGLLAPGHALRGTLGAEATVEGPLARPEIAGTLSLAGGAVDRHDGLALAGSGRWSGAERRLKVSLAASRAQGGAADVDLDLPLPAAGRPGERVLVRARAREVPVEEALAAAGSDLPLAGVAGLDAMIEGTAGAPTLALSASLAEGEWRDLDGVGVELAAEDGAERLRLSLRAALDAKPVFTVDGEVPLDLSELLARPAATLRALRHAPLEGSVALRGLELARISGRAGVPPRLGGVLDATAALAGTLAAPRGRASADLRAGAWGGYRELGGHLDATLSASAVALQGRLALAGEEAARFQASLGLPLERVGAAAQLRAAPLRAEVTIPRVSLARAATSADVPLTGVLQGKLAAAGTLRAPELTAALAGDDLAVEGRPLGKARLDARYQAARGSGEVVLDAAGGGTLRASLAASYDAGLGANAGALGDAPAELAVTADALDLGFLAAVAPGAVRSAGGKLALDLRARGPLARLSPRGTLTLADGRIAITEWGDYDGIAAEVAVGDDAVEVSRLEVHRGKGKISATGALRGLRSGGHAALEAHLRSDGFTVARAGMDVASVDLRADATGSWDGSTLAVDVHVPRGVIRLPKRQPRKLQTLETRKDIVVGRRAERKRQARAVAVPAAAGQKPFTLRATLVAERELWVKSDDPRVDLELRANVTYERTGAEDYAEGSVEVVHGTAEPIGGRNFTIDRGRVQFTGGPPSAATLDIEAKYENPAAVVTVTIEGPARSPKVHFSSEPPMDEAAIAMLIATGRTDLKAGGGSVATLSGQDAGMAALGVVATQAFKNLVADKLPVDSVSLDASGFKAGTYIGKFYVIYQRRFDADPLKGENTDEVRVEYQITPRWMFESRWGNSQAGGANLVWSKEY